MQYFIQLRKKQTAGSRNLQLTVSFRPKCIRLISDLELREELRLRQTGYQINFINIFTPFFSERSIR